MPKQLHEFRFLPLFMVGFVVCIMTSNILCAKQHQFGYFFFGPLILAGGTLFYPLTYIFADTLTEVYGYNATRKTIWCGFAALLYFTAAAYIVQILPAAPYWTHQNAYETILGSVWQINAASLLAYLCGEFCNSTIVAKMKLRAAKHVPEGQDVNRGMGLRFMASTTVGQLFDSLIFVTAGFVGSDMPLNQMANMFISTWIFKVLWELVALRWTIKFVKRLKIKEGTDALDRDTDFNPLHANF